MRRCRPGAGLWRIHSSVVVSCLWCLFRKHVALTLSLSNTLSRFSLARASSLSLSCSLSRTHTCGAARSHGHAAGAIAGAVARARICAQGNHWRLDRLLVELIQTELNPKPETPNPELAGSALRRADPD